MERLILVRLSEAMPLKDSLLASLSGKRKEKALRYVREKDQVRSAVGSLLIRKYVGDGELILGPKGKPSLPGETQFNLSHSGDFVGLYVSEEPVGLDIEEIDRCDLSIVRGAFTPEEALSIHDQESFALAWTRKEAVTKCLGSGIENPTRLGLVALDDGSYQYQGTVYWARSLTIDGHVATMAKATDSRFPEAEFVRTSSLL